MDEDIDVNSCEEMVVILMKQTLMWSWSVSGLLQELYDTESNSLTLESCILFSG